MGLLTVNPFSSYSSRLVNEKPNRECSFDFELCVCERLLLDSQVCLYPARPFGFLGFWGLEIPLLADLQSCFGCMRIDHP